MVAMGRPARRVWALLSVLLLAACTSASHPSPSPSPQKGIGSAARAYLMSALDIMQAHALNRARLDWPFLRQRALHEAATVGARTPADVYGVIMLTLGNLADNFHSRFYAPGALTQLTQPGGAEQLPTGHMLTRSIGYLALPGDAELRDTDRRYVAAADAVFRSAEQHRGCGWVLDLRDDSGGDVWPMLMAAQPLLGSGTVGYFVPPAKPRIAVRVTPSAAYQDGTAMVSAVTPGRSDFGGEPVAVITGPHTASSGEFMTIAFRGRHHTKSLGLPTAGVPTANETYRLSDGAVLVLTSAQDADRTGHLYPDAPIRPDQAIATESPTATDSSADPAIRAARKWLTTEEGCEGR